MTVEFFYFTLAIPLVFYSYTLSRHRGIPFYSNYFFIFILFLQGLIIKPVFISLEIPSNEIVESVISPVLLDDYWTGSILTLPIYLLFMVSMVYFSPKRNSRDFTEDKRSSNQVFNTKILLLMLIISIIGFGGFLYQFPILITTLSKASLATSSLQDYRSGSFFRLVISFGYTVSILSLWNIGKKFRVSESIFIFTCSAIIYIAYSIISDQRSMILVSCFIWLVSYHLFIRKISAKKVCVIISIFILIVIFQTIHRVEKSNEINSESIKSSIANFIGRNGIEHSKTIHIINSVPSELDFMLGESFVDSIAILIPRELFPDKSTVNIETVVGQNFFNSHSYGAGAVPPGVIAEMYMNFGWLGILLGAVLAGAITGLIEKKFLKTKFGSPYFFFYLITLYTFGASVIGSSLSNTVTSLIINLVPFLICYVSSKVIYK